MQRVTPGHKIEYKYIYKKPVDVQTMMPGEFFSYFFIINGQNHIAVFPEHKQKKNAIPQKSSHLARTSFTLLGLKI